jgi:hypothetical protein
MPDLKFTYDTYQDVRHNLFLYSLPFLVVAGFFTFFCVLPSEHQSTVIRVLDLISNAQPWKGLAGAGLGLVVFVALAFLMTELFQVHDQWYDKHVIKWRRRYDTDFILPKLIHPFASRTNYRFYEVAETHDFLPALYYPFVGDRDLKIPKNKLVRFYEVVTVYWLTQVNEIVLLLLTGAIVFYRFRGPATLDYRTQLLNDCVVVGCCFILNRAWVRSSQEKVRRATEEEIRAIHDDPALLKDLERRLGQACRDYAIPYEQAPEG